MVTSIAKGNTVIDYFNLLITLFEVDNKSIHAFSCNRLEWVQFLNLIKTNYDNCRDCVETIDPTTTKYKDIVVYYDGTEDDSDNYGAMMYDLQNLLEDQRRLNTTPPDMNANPTIEPQRTYHHMPDLGRADVPRPATTAIRVNAVRQGRGWQNVGALAPGQAITF